MTITHTDSTEKPQVETAAPHPPRRARAAWPARLLNRAGSVVNVTVCDVSESGVGLLGETNLTVDTVLDVTLSVPDARRPRRAHAVRVSVRVLGSSPVGSQYRIDAQFVEVPLETRVAIRSYVLAHS